MIYFTFNDQSVLNCLKIPIVCQYEYQTSPGTPGTRFRYCKSNIQRFVLILIDTSSVYQRDVSLSPVLSLLQRSFIIS